MQLKLQAEIDQECTSTVSRFIIQQMNEASLGNWTRNIAQNEISGLCSQRGIENVPTRVSVQFENLHEGYCSWGQYSYQARNDCGCRVSLGIVVRRK